MKLIVQPTENMAFTTQYIRTIKRLLGLETKLTYLSTKAYTPRLLDKYFSMKT